MGRDRAYRTSGQAAAEAGRRLNAGHLSAESRQPVTAAEAAPVHVLTTGKVGGTAVKPGAVLKASLAKGKSVVFKNSLGTLTCTRSTFTAKVVTNPAKPGTARESITAETFSGCRISLSGVTIKSQSVRNLPYNATVSDARGNPVHISGRSKALPLLLTVTVKAGTATITCSVKAAGPNGICPASGTFSAAYGPVRDSSVTGSPAVFVN